MKKAAFILAVSVMAACCLIAWDATKDSVLKNETVENEVLKSYEEETTSTEEPVSITTKEPESVSTTDELTEIDDTEKQRLLSEQNNLYAFSKLSEDEKNIYAEILLSLTNFERDVVLSTTSFDTMDKAFQCVMMDHPEIFYIDGYKYTTYTVADKVKRLTFSGNYIYTKEETDIRNRQIVTATGQIIGGISQDASDYEKVKYIYETIVNQTEYVLNAPDNQNICSVFLSHQSVCQGYAKAMQYLLNQMNVPTTIVVGTVKNGEGHAWNLVLIDGAYYYVDPTWGDAYYLLSNQDMENTNSSTPSINYDYLCVTTPQIQETHTINSVVPMPNCADMAANYYVMEGAYFVEYNEEKIQDVFNRAKEQQKEAVTLKCATQAVYDEMINELITNQKVFSFFPNLQGSVAYTTCEEQRSISFWL